MFGPGTLDCDSIIYLATQLTIGAVEIKRI